MDGVEGDIEMALGTGIVGCLLPTGGWAGCLVGGPREEEIEDLS
jgi:hypothetical protein